MIEIPNYEIGKLAGRGGVAEVYLARHKLLDRTVAIKLIAPAHADDLADKRFLKEAKVVAGLRHPNIVSIYDVGVLANKYYIIMEYLEGGDLKQHVKRGLSITQSLAITRQIASALANAHDKGFIHRDIKSQNIMFRGDGTAVLTDFGIVKDLRAETGYTLDGTSIGTPHYMSPEQAQGAAKIDWRTDLYSLGVTFYEMLTGSPPYNADSAIAVALKHIKDPVPRLPDHLIRFQPVIDKLMAKNPEDRFQSAHDLIVAIERLEGKDTPTEAFAAVTQVLVPEKKISPLRIFIAVAAISIVGGMVMLNWPDIVDLMDGHQLLERSQAREDNRNGSADGKSTGAASGWKGVFATGRSGRINEKLLSRAISNKDYASALDYILKTRKEMPAVENEMIIKADRFLASGQLTNAADIYNTVISVDPENASAVLGLMNAAIEKQVEITGREKPSIADHESLLGLQNKAIGSTGFNVFKLLQINTVESLFENAKSRYAQSDFQSADRWVQAGLKYAPDHLRLKKLNFRIKAQICFDQDRLTLPEEDNALTFYRQILLLDPEDPGAKEGIAKIVSRYRDMAKAAREEKKYADAAELMAKARLIAPEDVELKAAEWMILGDMYFEQGRYTAPENENALNYYRKVLVLEPGQPRAAERIAEIEVRAPLQQVRQAKTTAEKIPAYRNLFASIESASGQNTSRQMDALQDMIASQVKSDIDDLKKKKSLIPIEFVELISARFPQMKPDLAAARYDILLARGDASAPEAKSAEFYIQALALNPDGAPARSRIENQVTRLYDSGKSSEAEAILKQAMQTTGKDAGFDRMLKTIRALQAEKTGLYEMMHRIKQLPSLPEKADTYFALFSRMDAAMSRYGAKKLTDVKTAVAAQIRADVDRQKQNRQIIPPAFLAQAARNFPEISDDLFQAQYDILIARGDAGATAHPEADYLEALKLAPDRADARVRIEQMALQLDRTGSNADAVALLRQGAGIAPDHERFAELVRKIQRVIRVFATAQGCGNQNIIIYSAPVSSESIDLCIQYANTKPDTVISVLLENQNGQSVEVPVVLNNASGNKGVTIDAPVEGFMTGTYSISVKQNDKILSETQIEFVPKRR